MSAAGSTNPVWKELVLFAVIIGTVWLIIGHAELPKLAGFFIVTGVMLVTGRALGMKVDPTDKTFMQQLLSPLPLMWLALAVLWALSGDWSYLIFWSVVWPLATWCRWQLGGEVRKGTPPAGGVGVGPHGPQPS